VLLTSYVIVAAVVVSSESRRLLCCRCWPFKVQWCQMVTFENVHVLWCSLFGGIEV